MSSSASASTLQTLAAQLPPDLAARMNRDIQGAFSGVPQVVAVAGPRRFFRAASPGNRVYGGTWWFDENVLVRLENKLSRIPLTAEQKDLMTRNRLREGLAVSMDWNPMSELWTLAIPQGESLTGLVGIVREQPVFSASHADYDPNRILAGGEIQYYFPVRNPLWVYRYK